VTLLPFRFSACLSKPSHTDSETQTFDLQDYGFAFHGRSRPIFNGYSFTGPVLPLRKCRGIFFALHSRMPARRWQLRDALQDDVQAHPTIVREISAEPCYGSFSGSSELQMCCGGRLSNGCSPSAKLWRWIGRGKSSERRPALTGTGRDARPQLVFYPSYSPIVAKYCSRHAAKQSLQHLVRY